MQFGYQRLGLCIPEKMDGLVPFFPAAGLVQIIQAVQPVLLVNLNIANRDVGGKGCSVHAYAPV